MKSLVLCGSDAFFLFLNTFYRYIYTYAQSTKKNEAFNFKCLFFSFAFLKPRKKFQKILNIITNTKNMYFIILAALGNFIVESTLNKLRIYIINNVLFSTIYEIYNCINNCIFNFVNKVFYTTVF